MTQYAAFISYRHLPRDLDCANWLVEALETYRIPDDLLKQGFPQRIGQVFRDDNELSSNGDLNQAVKEALFAAEHLIVVCSKGTPMSAWVRKEITLFKHWGRADNIHAVLIGDNPQASYPPELTYWRTIGEGLDVKEEFVEPLGLSISPLQNQTESEAKELVRDKLIARMIKCDLATLRDREAARRNKDTTYQYFHTMVRRWGVPEGVGLLTDTQVSRRIDSLKFHTREGKVQKVERINSLGYFNPDNNGICQWDISYRADGKVEAVDLRNRHGNVKTREVYSRDLTKVDFHDDNDAASYQVAMSGFGMSDQQNTRVKANNAGITRHLLSYNEQGFVIRKRYAKNSSNQPARDAFGNYGEEFIINEVGLVTTQYYLDVENNRITQRNGVGNLQNVYGKDFYEIEKRYFDLNDQPVNCSRGYHFVNHKYDKFGNIISFQLFDHELAPCADTSQIHLQINVINENGFWVEAAFYDAEQKLTKSKFACSIFKYEYDSYGNQIKLTHFDEKNKSCHGSNGLASAVFTYDNQGNRLSEAGYDEIGKPSLCKFKYHRRTSQYDCYGNVVENSFYDVLGKLTITSFGAAVCRYIYDEKGNQIEGRYFDELEEPCLQKAGYHHLKQIYDEKNNIIEDLSFDTLGSLCININGFARRVLVYDEASNIIEMYLYDELNQPIKPGVLVGIFKYVYEYDTKGNQIKESYFGPNNEPILSDYQIHSVKFVYDRVGNKISEKGFDQQNNPTLGNIGFFRLDAQFDTLGRVIEHRCYDTSELPCLNTDGIHCIQYTYNHLSKVTHIACFGAQLEPIETVYGFQRGERTFKNFGQPEETRYFDLAGNLLSNIHLDKETDDTFWLVEDE